MNENEYLEGVKLKMHMVQKYENLANECKKNSVINAVGAGAIALITGGFLYSAHTSPSYNPNPVAEILYLLLDGIIAARAIGRAVDANSKKNLYEDKAKELKKEVKTYVNGLCI